jgi:hypothetical protein
MEGANGCWILNGTSGEALDMTSDMLRLEPAKEYSGGYGGAPPPLGNWRTPAVERRRDSDGIDAWGVSAS